MKRKAETTMDDDVNAIGFDEPPGATDDALAAMKAERARLRVDEERIRALDTAIAAEEDRQRNAAVDAALVELDLTLDGLTARIFALPVGGGDREISGGFGRPLSTEDRTAVSSGNAVAMRLRGLAEDHPVLVARACGPLSASRWTRAHIDLGRRTRQLGLLMPSTLPPRGAELIALVRATAQGGR
jgi:hypothetical protein